MSTDCVHSDTENTQVPDHAMTILEFSRILANANFDGHSNEIVATLGGIDKILNEYVRISQEYDSADLLNSDQMQHISDLLADERTTNTENDQTQIEEDTQQEQSLTIWDRMYTMAKLENDTFHLSYADTILHAIIANKRHVDRLMGFLYSKYTVIGLCLIVLPFVILFFVDNSIWQRSWYALTIIAVYIPMAMYFILLILSCNKPVFLLVITGFDFWVKLGYGVMATILFITYVRKANDFSWEQILFMDIAAIILTIMIVLLSVIEGYAVKWSTAFALGLMVSLSITYRAVMLTFAPERVGLESQVLVELTSGLRLDVLELLASALRVLALFFWKQTLMTAYTGGEWCICIYMTPQIKWDGGKKEREIGKSTGS